MNSSVAKRVHILILEDNPDDAKLAFLKLEDAGLEVDGEVAHNSAEFMERVRSNVYDAILCDYQIPGWSGRDALRWLRASDKETPFIFVSGTLGEELAVECIKEGATDYVLKGNLGRLPVAVRRALSDMKLQELNAQLEQRIAERIADLERSNRLLQDEMEEREKAERELRQAQRLDAVGRLAGGVAHDFNNLLGIILGQSEILLEQSKDQTSTHRLDVIRESVERGAALTRQLLAFGKQQVLETKVLNFNMILADVEKLVRLGIGENIELEFQTEAKLGNIEADPGQLEQVILNLALNARDAMPAGGKLTITTANLQLDEAYADRSVIVRPGRYVQVVVSDTGCGMDEQTQSRIFEPFFTTKEQGRGTGLGLATVYGIVKQSGGYIWVYTKPGHGTAFKIYLPMVETPAESPQYLERSEELPRGSETILMVEGDAALREVTYDFLQSRGYVVIPAGSPEEALQLAELHDGTIDFLLTDVIMPKMSGHQLAARLSKVRPEMKVLYVSGYADGITRDGVHEASEGGLAFLQKPYTHHALNRKIRETIDAKRVNSLYDR
jgi:two-component system cell cycle sensor histidine kinase/response regulator CckA